MPGRLTPTRVAGWLHPGVRQVATTVDVLHRRWEEHNRRQTASAGPLWVALGDSTAIGVGASGFDRTALQLVHRALCRHSGESWRLVNLGRHGAKLDAVVQTQLPRLGDWGTPDLVTVGAGANDVVWSVGLVALLESFTQLLDAVPDGTVVGTVPPGWTGKGLRVNDWLRAQAPRRGLRLAEVGVFPRPRTMVAADRFHPNDDGYRFIADGVLAALGLPATAEAPEPPQPRPPG
jgi:acyl-CoA thioesterase I